MPTAPLTTAVWGSGGLASSVSPGQAREGQASPPIPAPSLPLTQHNSAHLPTPKNAPCGSAPNPRSPGGPQASTVSPITRKKMEHFHNRKSLGLLQLSIFPCRTCAPRQPLASRPLSGWELQGPGQGPPWPACSLHALVNTHFASNMAECTWDKNKALSPRVRNPPGPEPPSAPACSPVSFLSHIMHVFTGARACRKARNRTQPSTSVLLPRHVAADDDHDSASPAPLSSLTSLIHHWIMILPHNTAINYSIRIFQHKSHVKQRKRVN